MSAFADKTLKCLDCNQDFVYAAAEQELHKSLGYQNEPKRCGPCREAKRNRKGPRAEGGERPAQPQQSQTPRPPQPQQGPRPPREGGGDRDRGRGPRGGGGDRRGGGRPPQEPRREQRQAPEGGPVRDTFIALCAGCGKEAVLPFKPRGDRPIFCIECFEQKKAATS